MKRRGFSLAVALTALAALLSFTLRPALAAESNTLANFQKTRAYTAGTFTDIGGQWYTSWIERAYEYGLISGIGDNQYNPAGSLTGAEALTIGARIHATYKYGAGAAASEIEKYQRGGGRWYDMYAAYCKAEGLIGNQLDGKLEAPLTRAEMVFAWSRLLLPRDMPKQNTVHSLPDVGPSTPYRDEIIYFYEAGVLTGTDGAGTFLPGNYISRAEAAAIFMRIVEARESGRTFGQPPMDASAFEREVFDLVNIERAKQGIAPLQWDDRLADVARAHSTDMSQKNYFAHDSLDGRRFSDRIRNAGITFRAAAENIAWGYRTPKEVMEGWMNSPGHRANILNANYTHLGVGFYNNYWTQDFIG